MIIRNNREYLIGVDVFGNLKWSSSPYDAWKTRVRAKAKSVQMKTGGEIVLFNPAIGATKTIEIGGIKQ